MWDYILINRGVVKVGKVSNPPYFDVQLTRGAFVMKSFLRKAHFSKHTRLLYSFKILLAQCVRAPGGTGSSLGLGDRRVANAKQVLKKDFA